MFSGGIDLEAIDGEVVAFDEDVVDLATLSAAESGGMAGPDGSLEDRTWIGLAPLLQARETQGLAWNIIEG